MLAEDQTLLAEHVFRRLTAIWGARFLQLWRGADLPEVYRTWEAALRSVARDRVDQALIDCQNADKPPTLPEFLALCRSHRSSVDGAPALALTFDGRETPRDVARENLAKIRAMLGSIRAGRAGRDPMFWAKHPKSRQAVQLLLRGAKRDHRLREILLNEVDTGMESCRSEEAVKALIDLVEAGEIDKLRGLDPARRQPGEEG